MDNSSLEAPILGGGSGLLHPGLLYVRLLGKNPEDTFFRTLGHERANTKRKGEDLKGFDLAVLERDCRSLEAVCVVVGNVAEPSRVSGCVKAADIASLPALFVEWDDKPKDWQIKAWKELMLPQPSFQVWTGGKSVHSYWVLDSPLPPEEFREAQKRLSAHCASDASLSKPCQLMRLPGFAYIDKKTRKPVDICSLLHVTEARYRVEEVLANVPECAENNPTVEAFNQSSMERVSRFPPRSIEEIRAAVLCFPRRVKNGNTYPKDRDALCGCSAAFMEAGLSRDEADAAALDLLGPLWPSERDALQVLKSAHTRAAGSFWKKAISHGHFPWEQKPLSAKASKRRKGKERRLTFDRRMRCLAKCVRAVVIREPNSFRCRTRLLKVVKDLQLSPFVKADQIAQMVLEARAKEAGEFFQVLTATDRASMANPDVCWLLPGVLPANDLTIIGGRPKVGKTRLAIAIAAAVLGGENILGLPDPPSPQPVLLVTDDQADGDTKQMCEEAGIWNDVRLAWSPHFRLTEADLDQLLATIKRFSGSLVVLDSLRSIGRALGHGENDPEIGATLYDLKQAVIDAGGTLLLIHHCNKTEVSVGTEALSGHNAIAGAANTVLTLHYLPGEGGLPNKSIPERRLFREARSGPGFDLVVNGRGFHKLCSFDDWQKQASQVQAMERLDTLKKEVLDVLGAQWMTRRQVCEELEVEWVERGRGAKPQQVERALRGLVHLNQAESQKEGGEVLYRLSRGA